MFSLFTPTDWSFVTSGGAEMTFGLSKLLYAGGSGGAFYVRQGASGAIQRLPMLAAVIGGGLGISAGGPVTVSVSMPFAPGGGFRIYRNPLRSATLTLNDFPGAFLQLSGGGGTFIFNRNVSLLIFGSPNWLVSVLSIGNPAARLPALVASCEGVGALWGSAVSSAASVGIEVYSGEILTSMAADPGETG
jgi:hypothetical protein